MHQYLKSIGFDDIRDKEQLIQILKDVEESYTGHQLIQQDEKTDLCEYEKEYGERIGIAIYGDLDMNEIFYQRYYLPYFKGTGVTSYADVSVERRMDREAYIGICEDTKVGINLVFSLQNMMEYLKEKKLGGKTISYSSVTLAGLSEGGTILLPVLKSREQEKEQQEEVHNRMMLLSAAKTGDPQAIESLTLDDIDTYSRVSRRLISEDVFTIVDTYMMPCGVECDRYSILGEIRECRMIQNDITRAGIWIMKLDVNGLLFDVCVPARNLMGEPAVGRRYKGNIWLQGRINFKKQICG